MSSVDNRIVKMQFDNAQFEAGIRQTLGSLAALEKAMAMPRAGAGLSNLNAAAKKVDLSPIAAQTADVENRFSVMAGAAAVALGNIATKAAIVGGQIAKSLSIAPVMEGFSDYELKIGATQTIMAGTGESIGTVTKYLKELDIYADETIYSLSDMVSNIGKFTNAGVKLPVAVEAMKGISNVAALSGASTNEAARAMYNLGQAIGNGTVKLMDWRSVELANMGTKEFKTELINSAVAAGTLTKGLDGTIKSSEGNIVNFKTFSSTLQDGWLTADALTATLSRYADASSDIGKRAYKAAKDVKTFGMMVTTLKAAMGTGWTDTFDIIVGDLPEATEMFTKFTNVFGRVISDSANARNKVLLDWDKAGGRTALIDGILAGLEAVGRIIGTVKDAFRTIFPATTGAQLAEMTKSFQSFMEKIQIGSETAANLKSTFSGLFAILGIGWEIIKGVAGFFGELFSEMSNGEGSFLKITASIGDFLTNLHSAIKNGEGLKNFFSGLAAAVKVPIRIIQNFGKSLADALGKLNLGKVNVGGFVEKFKPLENLGDRMAGAWKSVLGVLDNVWAKFMPLADKIADFFSSFGGKVAGGGFDISKLVTAVNIGAITAITVSIVGMIKGFDNVIDAVKDVVTSTDDLVSAVQAPFEALTDTLGAMQNTLRVATLIQIAGAVALLAYAVVKLSQVDEKGLSRALKALTVLFIQLAITMAIFQKIEINSGFFQIVLLAAAILILANAVETLAAIDFVDLLKGLAGVYILLGGLVLTMKLMPKGANTIKSAAAIVIMAYAVKMLADSVTDLSGLSWEEMARGLAGTAALLLALGLFAKFGSASKGGVLSGLGIILLAAGIKVMASALKDLSGLSWDEMGRGLAAMAGGMAIMGAALALIPPSSILSAAAILVVAVSLGMIGDALAEMGSMSWEEIGKAMVAMGGSLLLISAAMYAMTAALPGAAALIVVAAAFQILMPVLQKMGDMSWEAIAKGLVMLGGALLIIAVAMNAMTTAIFGAAALIVVAGALNILLPIMMLLGQMSWESIAKGLIMLAGTFLVIGIAGALLTPVIPTLIGLGLAITLLGVGILAAGLGLLAFSAGLTALSIAGAAGAAAIVAIVAALVGTIPMIFKQVGIGLVELANVIAKSGPAFMRAGVALIMALLGAIQKTAPKIIETILMLMTKLLAALAATVPKMVTAGMRLIVGILNGIAANLGRVITAATNVIVAFLNGIGKNLPRIIQAGMRLIIDFCNGLSRAIDQNSAAMGAAGARLAVSIVKGMVRGIAAGIGEVAGAAKRVAQSAIDAAKGILKINSPSKAFIAIGEGVGEGFVIGIKNGSGAVLNAMGFVQNIVNKAIKDNAAAIKKYEAQLKKLNSAKKKDTKAIAATTAALSKAREEYTKLQEAMRVSKTFADETEQLNRLVARTTTVAEKLVEANKAVEDAKKKSYSEYSASTKDQFDNLPDPSKDTKLTDYIVGLEQQIVDTQILNAQLQKLSEMGLSNAMYNELLAKGTDAIPFIAQILEGGPASVSQLNALSSALDSSASALATTAGKSLYEAGVRAAEGLVEGLKSEQAAIKNEMITIANGMTDAIKIALGIKSPSREFMKIGDWSAKGLAAGLAASAAPIKAAEAVGHNAIEAMRKTLTGLGDIVAGEVDVNPTISPVLDLTEVKKDASRIGNLLNLRPLEVGGAYSLARSASSEYKANQLAAADQAANAGAKGPTLQYVQNNYSPKALPQSEIYRQTRNQLSTLKGAVKKTP